MFAEDDRLMSRALRQPRSLGCEAAPRRDQAPTGLSAGFSSAAHGRSPACKGVPFRSATRSGAVRYPALQRGRKLAAGPGEVGGPTDPNQDISMSRVELGGS